MAKRRPEDAEVEETHRFVAPLLVGCRRILDVGCGNGLLARRLVADGFQVTGLDRSLKKTERARSVRFVEGDFLEFDEAPFDALVFSASLHHLSPLERALESAHRLLRPGGLLVASDFDLDAPDEATARWYYDLEGLLVAAGLYPEDRVCGSEEDDPLSRWHEDHVDDPPFHRGAAMKEAIARKFSLLGEQRGPYLYRYVVGGLVHTTPRRHTRTARGTAGAASFDRARIAAWALAAEQRGIAAGALKPVGLRLWAKK